RPDPPASDDAAAAQRPCGHRDVEHLLVHVALGPCVTRARVRRGQRLHARPRRRQTRAGHRADRGWTPRFSVLLRLVCLSWIDLRKGRDMSEQWTAPDPADMQETEPPVVWLELPLDDGTSASPSGADDGNHHGEAWIHDGASSGGAPPSPPRRRVRARAV